MVHRIGLLKLALTAVLAGGTLALLPASALAKAVIKLSPSLGTPTTPVKVAGTGYPAGGTIDVAWDGVTDYSTFASSSGAFALSFPVPADASPGSHTVTASDGGVSATATFVVRTDWLLPYFAYTGATFDPYENTLSPSNAQDLSELATLSLAGAVRSEPIYAGGEIIVGAGDTVQAVNAGRRQLLWTFTAQGPVVGSPISVSSPCHVLIAESQDGSIYGLSPATGGQLWTDSTGTQFTGSPMTLVPAVQHGEEVVAAADNGSVYALNACTGASFWSDVESGPASQPVTPAVLRSAVSPDGTTHTVIIDFDGNTVQGIDALTGDQLWSATEPNAITAGPVVYGSGMSTRVLLGDGANAVELNGGTGGTVWSRPVQGSVSGISLYETTGTTAQGALTTKLVSVIVGDGGGDVYSLAPPSGKVNWGDHGYGPVDGAPAVANGVIYFTTAGGPSSPGALVAVNAAAGGGILNADELNPQPYPPGPPSIADGTILVGDFDSSVAVFGLSGGEDAAPANG